MNWRTIRAIARKDLYEVRANRMAWMPMLLLPVIFCVVIPVIFVVLPNAISMPSAMNDVQELKTFFAMFPETLRSQVELLNDHQLLMYFVLAFMFAPMFMIMPVMMASVISAESFVGEKERKTMEALLYTPATETELFLGKALASAVPAVLIAWGSFAFYTVVLNVLGGPIMGRVWFPTPTWWPLMLWLAPAFAVLGVLGMVVVSSRVQTFMAAYQTSGLLVLPVLVLMIGQLSGVVYLSPEVVFLVGVAVWVLDAVLLAVSLKIFSRRSLMETGKL
jgi:ABC-type transport system involved in multi-copper enzyme maturation permease subunit